MNRLLRGLHPTFDALSAHADRSDVERTHMRVGRHIDGCATCGATIAEIHALGDEARAMPPVAAPPGLRARIEAAAKAAPASPAPAPRRAEEEDDDRNRAAPELRPTHTFPVPRLRRRTLATLTVAALAAAVVLAVAWPRADDLQAANPGRLTFSPARPVPGGRLSVRYRPAPWMRDAERLVLVGRFARPAGRNPAWFGGRMEGQLADSIAMLTRRADGDFSATVRLPDDFLAVDLVVVDPVRDRRDQDARAWWIVIGATRAGMPSLPSLLAALEITPRWISGGDPDPTIADSLTRYFPRHPAGWAHSRTYGVAKGRFDLLRFFQSAERQYAAMFDALWPTVGLDAERLHDMVVFAHNISEPGEALRWAERFARERPEDPRALPDLAGAMHEIELRQPQALGDSIRNLLPLLDRAYRAAPVPSEGFLEAARLAESYGDSATRARWDERKSASFASANIWILSRWRSGTSDTGLESELTARVRPGCSKPPGRFPFDRSVARWQTLCNLYSGMAYGALSSHSLDAKRLDAASAEADSALASMARADFCGPSLAYMNRGRVALLRGDTTAAEDAFIHASAGYTTNPELVLDTMRVRLGSRYQAARYAARLDSVRREFAACTLRARARQREASRLGGG